MMSRHVTGSMLVRRSFAPCFVMGAFLGCGGECGQEARSAPDHAPSGDRPRSKAATPDAGQLSLPLAVPRADADAKTKTSHANGSDASVDGGSAHRDGSVDADVGSDGSVTVSTDAPPGPAKYPVRWTRHVKLSSLRAIATELTRVHKRSLGTLHLWNQPGTEVKVRSCTQAFDLHTKGYEEVLPFTFKGDPYIARCRPLALLKEAKASRASFIGRFNVRRLEFDKLPPRLGTAFSHERSEVQEEMERHGGSWLDFAPSLHVKRDSSVLPDAVRVDVLCLAQQMTMLAIASRLEVGWEYHLNDSRPSV